jgi:hypothetical protein
MEGQSAGLLTGLNRFSDRLLSFPAAATMSVPFESANRAALS